MYPVSSIFQTLMKMYRSSSSWDSVYGTLKIRTASGISTFSFDESSIIQGDLWIKDQLGDGKFGYGGCYVRNIGIKLDCDKIEGLNAINVNLTNAEVELWYRLVYNNGNSHEDVYMGKFYVDGRNSSRKNQMLYLVGEDSMSKLDVASVAMSESSPYQIYQKACELAGLTAFTTQEEIEAFPNGTMSLTFGTSQIQTARDMVMWVGKLTGTIARVKRTAEQGIELVQIPTKYTDYNTLGNFDYDAFVADNGTEIPADIRFKSEYTDTSVRIHTLMTDLDGEKVIYENRWTADSTPAPDTLEGAMELESNPLLSGQGSYKVKQVLKALLGYTEHLRMCPFTVLFKGNPAIEIGDFVYLPFGGSIDDNQRHYGIVTYHKWVFQGKSEIRCEYGGTSSRPLAYQPQEEAQTETQAQAKSTKKVKAVSRAAAALTAETSDTSTVEVVPPKSQFEKKLTGNEKKAETAKYLQTVNQGYILSTTGNNISLKEPYPYPPSSISSITSEMEISPSHISLCEKLKSDGSIHSELRLNNHGGGGFDIIGKDVYGEQVLIDVNDKNNFRIGDLGIVINLAGIRFTHLGSGGSTKKAFIPWDSE